METRGAHEALAWLVDALGAELTGQIAGHEGPDVLDWLTGRMPVPEDAGPRLALAGAVTALLLADELPAIARRWWFTPQPLLGGKEPWQMVNIDPDGVLDAARAFLGEELG